MPVAAPDAMAQRAAPSCAADARGAWRSGPVAFTVEAYSFGSVCSRATATLVIRRSDGEPVYADVFFHDRNFAFLDATTPAKVRAALRAWIDQSDPSFRSTHQLPPWDNAQGMPASGEFPFYPEEAHATPEAWEALRKRRAPMFCFIQGMESVACLVYDSTSGQMEKIGAQSFPG